MKDANRLGLAFLATILALPMVINFFFQPIYPVSVFALAVSVLLLAVKEFGL